jgi:hypothetical protein
MLKPERVKEEDGQALIEFIMIIPLLMAFVWYIVHINLAINKSIVGQKHARSQLFVKLYNHRSGPVTDYFGNTDRSHFYIGVSGEVVRGSQQYPAPVEVLGLGPAPKKLPDLDDSNGEAAPGSLRQRVRIRTAFGICTHRKTVKDGSGPTDFCGSEPEN